MVEEKRKPETPQEKALRLRNRELNDLRVILNTPEGRRFFWRLLSKAQVFIDGYVPGDNGYGTARNTGMKFIGHWALNELLEAKPSAFTQMQREHASELKREELVEEQYKDEKDILSTKEE